MNLEKDTWSVIANYFESNPKYLTKHHLDSFNDFTNNKIYDIFNDIQFNPQVVVTKDKENPDIIYLINVYYGGRNKNQIEINEIYLDYKTNYSWACSNLVNINNL